MIFSNYSFLFRRPEPYHGAGSFNVADEIGADPPVIRFAYDTLETRDGLLAESVTVGEPTGKGRMTAPTIVGGELDGFI